MQTILTEKGSAMEHFVQALGGPTGELNGSPYTIVKSRGHLFEYKPLGEMVPQEFAKQFTNYSIENLPFDRSLINFEHRIVHNSKLVNGKRVESVDDYAISLFRTIKQSIDRSDTVIIATDTDPSGEGDLLAWEIINACNFKGKVLRCRFTDEEVPTLRAALRSENLEEVHYSDPLVEAAIARSQFDYYTIQYSRLTSGVSKGVHKLPNGGFIREGKVKSAMSSSIGQRELDHDMFKPSSAYELVYRDSDSRVFRKPKMDRYATAAQTLSANGGQYSDATTVKKLSEELKKVEPPKLYDLMGLAGAISQLGFDSDLVMSTYQKMYDAKYVSYPRTDDKVITEDQLIKIKKIVPDLIRLLGVDGSRIDLNLFRRKSLYKVGDSGAAPSHGANRPGEKLPESIAWLREFGELGPIIYEVLARQILSQFSPSKENLVTTYSDGTAEFKYRVTETKDLGWSVLLKKDGVDLLEKTDDDPDTNNHPNIGSELTLGAYEVKAIRPALFTLSTLRVFLDKYDIGTGATRLNTFTDISSGNANRKLVKKEGQRLRLTTLGKLSFALMSESKLSNIEFCQGLNKFLGNIKLGQGNRNDAGALFDKMFAHDLAKIKSNVTLLSSFKDVAEKGFERLTRDFNGESISFRSGIIDHKFSDDEVSTLLTGAEIRVPVTIKNRPAIAVGKLENDPTYGWGFKISKFEGKSRATHTGIYIPTNEEITFVSELQGTVFDALQLEQLLRGEQIEVSVYSEKYKKYFKSGGKLVKAAPYSNPNGAPVWQFGFIKREAAPTVTKRYKAGGTGPHENVDVTLPETYFGHKFTATELNSLYTGEPIEVELEFNSGKRMSKIHLAYLPNYNKPGKAVQLGFYRDVVEVVPLGQKAAVSIPSTSFGHKLTTDDLAKLAKDEIITFDGVKKDGSAFLGIKQKLTYGVPYGQTKKAWHLAFPPR